MLVFNETSCYKFKDPLSGIYCQIKVTPEAKIVPATMCNGILELIFTRLDKSYKTTML